MRASRPLRPGYLIPKPRDPRLIEKIAPPSPAAMMRVATPPIADIGSTAQMAHSLPFGTSIAGLDAAKTRRSASPSEGEEERVLRADQGIVDEGGLPVLIGAPRSSRAHRRFRPAARLGENARGEHTAIALARSRRRYYSWQSARLDLDIAKERCAPADVIGAVRCGAAK